MRAAEREKRARPTGELFAPASVMRRVLTACVLVVDAAQNRCSVVAAGRSLAPDAGPGASLAAGLRAVDHRLGDIYICAMEIPWPLK